MASIAALIGAQVIGGIGNNIASGLQEQRRQQEWNKMFGLKEQESIFSRDFANRQLHQQNDLTMRQQNLSFGGNMLSTGMQVGGSLIGNILSYNHSQDQLNFQKELNQQRRTDLQNEGLPLSYLHLGAGGGLGRSIPHIPMERTQTFGRNVSAPWGYTNSGTNLRDTYAPNSAPPSYQQATRTAPEQESYQFATTSSGKFIIP